MVHRHGVRAAFGLDGFGQVVDNPRVDVRQVSQADVAKTVSRKAVCFSRQQELRAVGSKMNDGVGAELALQPPVKRQVLVRRRNVSGVQQFDVVFRSARRLRHQHNVAQIDTRQHDGRRLRLVTVGRRSGRWLCRSRRVNRGGPDHLRPRGRTVGADDGATILVAQILEPRSVLLAGHQRGVAVADQRRQISVGPNTHVPAVAPHPRKQFVAVSRKPIEGVTLAFQLLEQAEEAFRRVEKRARRAASGHVRLAQVGVVIDDGEFLFRVGFVTQIEPGDGAVGHSFDPVGDRLVQLVSTHVRLETGHHHRVDDAVQFLGEKVQSDIRGQHPLRRSFPLFHRRTQQFGDLQDWRVSLGGAAFQGRRSVRVVEQ